MTTETLPSTVDLTGPAVRLWRHHDPEVADVPGVDLGTEVVTGDVAEAVSVLVARGVRRVGLTEPVDLHGSRDGSQEDGSDHGSSSGSGSGDTAAAVVRALVLVRELTSHAVTVDWRLRPPPGEEWRLLGHLYPPADVVGPRGVDIRLEWASTFHLCRFVYRHGPGFVQVRDRRTRDLACLTIDAPEYLAAIDVLRAGAPRSAVPAEVLADFAAEGLVGAVGGLAWWLPYRVRHWPWPTMTV